jgi:branched-chain amino acid transport system substrate-binding protein
MTLNKKRTLITAAVLAAFAVIFTILYVYKRPAKSGHRMIAVLPLTGNLAVVGTPKREAMELALEHARQDFPDVNFSIEYQDSLGQPRDGVAALNQAISLQKPDFAFVDLTPVVDAAIPVADSNRLLMFAGSAQAGITKKSQYVFRIFPGGDQEVTLISDYLAARRPKGVFVLHTNELYGRSVNELLKGRANGFSIIGSEEYGLADRDFRTQLTKARDSGAEIITLLGYGSEYPLLLQQAHELGIKPSRFMSNLGAVNIGVIKLSPELTEGITFAGPLFALRSDKLETYLPQKRLVEAYRQKYGRDPDFRVAFVYDTIMLLFRTLHNTNGVDQAATQLLNVKDYEGTSGRITITPDRDAVVDLVLATYKAGKPTPLEGR